MNLQRGAASRALLGLVWIGIAAAGCSTSGDSDRAVSDALTRQLGQHVRLFHRPTVDIDDIQPLARRFYRDRKFRPAWITSRGPTGDAKQLVEAIEASSREGLDPNSYGLDSVRSAMKDMSAGLIGPASDAGRLASLDLRLTRTFLGLAAHIALGQVNPKQLPADWHVASRTIDLVATLDQALDRHRVRDALLKDLPPTDPRFGRLRDALERYREIASKGGWPTVPPGASLRRGQRGERVKVLRARLAASGDLASAGSPIFDAVAEEGVRRFQLRHGLAPDGVVGERERAAMNVSVETRIHQIELNLERWRWRPKPFDARCVLVNIPDFSLQVIDHDQPVLTMRVVVGKQLSKTPIFSDEITYLVLNPFWNITQSVAAGEMLPMVQQDRDYLASHSIRVFDGPGEQAKEIDPGKVDWRSVSPEEFAYFLRQDPGPENPLGRIKFMCPNQFDVYLHDTPAGHLFSSQERDLSHGCIRLEKPLELAEYLLTGRPDSDRKALLAALGTCRDSSVALPTPIAVHIAYWTAWVDDQGQAQFRDDIYGLDAIIDRALGRAGNTAWNGGGTGGTARSPRVSARS